MVGMTQSRLQPQPAAWRVPLILALLVWLAPVAARAALQFDAFLGFDGMVPEASWFPLVCELKNDGPPFGGIIEITAPGGDGQSLKVPVELPTGTLKRLVIPLFSGARGFGSWDAHLYDERGITRGEQTGLRPRKQIAAKVPLIAALPRA